jgi:hypothetical protein
MSGNNRIARLLMPLIIVSTLAEIADHALDGQLSH